MQKYNEDFISKHLEKYPINLFELKNGGGVYYFSLEKIRRRILSSHLDETNVVISLDCGYIVHPDCYDEEINYNL